MLRWLPWIMAVGFLCIVAQAGQASYLVKPGQVRDLSLPELNDGAAKEKLVHFARKEEGDLVTETDHFRIVYKENPQLMEKIARQAEAARLQAQRYWFGGDPYEWDGKATIYLFASHKQYLKQTGVKALAHAQVRMNGNFVFSRSISLPCDVPRLFEDVLPHEVTHTVMANRFNGRTPRWANEGAAVLAESKSSMKWMRLYLRDAWQKKDLFDLEVLMTTDDIKHYGTIEYYAQSMSLVEFFVAEKGRRTFIQFLMDSVRQDCKKSLKKHYGFDSFEALEKKWSAFAFSDARPDRDNLWNHAEDICALPRDFQLPRPEHF